MKKLLILIVAAAVYLHYYPSPQLNAWWQQSLQWLDDKTSDYTDTKVGVKPSKLVTVLQPHFDKYSKMEEAYIRELATSRDNIREFHRQYCEEPKGNRRLNRNNQRQVCDVISQYRLL
ncbi:hypothetical protein FE810_07230 [Thalassotalea litorea]|uniref:Uncharacterized protein n=1 Tax=Thalassotalea litorea TaxID=2020715 RepID=A0A5R9IJH7_9GAMM|nr:hypothetical protein [Thalassotalea litorea]TLU65710.1 hypothetical protein FE810_07230 [Thalassotalea litorea]